MREERRKRREDPEEKGWKGNTREVKKGEREKEKKKRAGSKGR